MDGEAFIRRLYYSVAVIIAASYFSFKKFYC